MKHLPRIDSFSFGQIVIDGETITSDLVILPDGTIARDWWRQQSHILIPHDITILFDSAPAALIVGTGVNGLMRPDNSLILECTNRRIELKALPTAEAIAHYNSIRYTGTRTGACFHITC